MIGLWRVKLAQLRLVVERQSFMEAFIWLYIINILFIMILIFFFLHIINFSKLLFIIIFFFIREIMFVLRQITS